ncbi:MAG TPA: MFS transporter [Steroidobacteraceae bacterium]|nr:MFS transporter [Steroidobacteraceae bacterium]
MSSADSPSARLATRLAFLVAGFGVACWAPLVPYAKIRLAVDERMLGLLLLCLGIGSLLAMIFSGVLSSRFGSRPVIVASGFGLAATLPLLAIASTPLTLGMSLLLFGASLGALDVAMNSHAVEVERDAGRPLMSGFHALYSIGGFAGALFVTMLLSVGIAPITSLMIGSALMVLMMLAAWPRLLRTKAAEGEPHFALPRGVVLIIAVLAAITFLAEGALLDWSALLITGARLVDVKHGGVGYMFFAIAMTFGRFAGDALITRIGDRRALLWGGLVAIAGFVLLLTAPVAAVAMAGLVLIGLGAANIVPVLFRRAGNQTVMPPGLAIAAITTMGYAGILLGPAAIGFVAKIVGLTLAFWMLPALLGLVPLCSQVVAPRNSGSRQEARETAN